MASNPNNWNQYRLTQARSFADLIERLENEVTEPVDVLAMDFQINGQAYCITRPKEAPRTRRARASVGVIQIQPDDNELSNEPDATDPSEMLA